MKHMDLYDNISYGIKIYVNVFIDLSSGYTSAILQDNTDKAGSLASLDL